MHKRIHGLFWEPRHTSAALTVMALFVVLVCPASASEHEAIQLTGPGFDSVEDKWAISFDGEWLVYEQQSALWSVSTRGGTPVRLSSLTEQVRDFRITHDDDRVIFSTRDPAASTWRLFSINMSGPTGSEVALSDPATQVWIIGLRPQTNEVIYRLRVAFGDYPRYRVPVEGPLSARTELSVPNDGLGQDRLSSDGLYLVSTNLMSAIVAVNLDGTGSPINLKPPLSSDVTGFHFVLDSTQVIVSDGSLDLYSVPISGQVNTPVELSGDLDSTFVVTTNGDRILFYEDDIPEVYSVPIFGPSGSRVRLDQNPDLSLYEASLSEPSTVYEHSNAFTFPPKQLYAVPVGGPGSARVRINRPVTGTGLGVVRWGQSPGGQFVVTEESTFSSAGSAGYRSPTADHSSISELIWTISVDLQEFAFHPNGSFVGLVGDVLGQGDNDHLWIAPLNGTNHQEIKILDVGDIPNAVRIHSLRFGPRGGLFFAVEFPGSLNHIFTVPLIYLDGFERGDATGWQ